MPNISAPYNFVPLNKEVFFPPWAPFVNHDIPFKDGLSGNIDLNITTESPLFIGSGEEVKGVKQFVKDADGNYIIPAKTLGGEISNVFEILTFSKLNVVNDELFSVRDMKNSKLRGQANKCGFLYKTNKGYFVKNLSNILNISHIDLQANYEIDFKSDLYIEEGNGLTNKYNALVESREINYKIEKVEEENYTKSYAKIVKDSSEKGIIIFTNDITNKKNEFVFSTSSGELKPVKDKHVNDLIKIHKSSCYNFLLSQLENGDPIPVFCVFENSIIKSIGFTQIYKILYKNSAKDLVTNVNESVHSKKDLDFKETVFGHIENNKELKSRINFSHFTGDNITSNDEIVDELTMILSSPKPTFYPFYIQQNFQNTQTTLIDGQYKSYNNGEISGRKRYPITERNDLFYIEGTVFKLAKSNSTSSFKPLKTGVEFKGRVSFHNLLPQELGALLSSISFHNQGDNLRHSIGMAKPLGLGRIEIKTELKVDNKVEAPDKYLSIFEQTMNTQITNWINSNQLKELIAIATPITYNDEKMSYLNLDMDSVPKIDDFSDIKRNPKKALPRYSDFMNVEHTKTPQIIDHVINEFNYKDGLVNFKMKEQENLELKIGLINKKIRIINKELKRKKAETEKIELEKKRKLKKKLLLEGGIQESINNIPEDKILNRNILFKVIDNWLKKTKSVHIPEEDMQYVIDRLKNVYTNLRSDKKRVRWNSSKKNDWLVKKITSWFGVSNNEILKYIEEITNN